MQLRNSLYTVVEKEVEGMGGRFVVALCPSCFIYQAHFPGQPITPGVCLVQMGVELLEQLLEENLGRRVGLEMTRVKNVKFLSVVSPLATPRVEYQMKKVETTEENGVRAQIVVAAEGETKAKISLVLRMIS